MCVCVFVYEFCVWRMCGLGFMDGGMFYVWDVRNFAMFGCAVCVNVIDVVNPSPITRGVHGSENISVEKKRE